MDQTYTFQITPINGDAVHAQVSYALEKRTEFSSRKKFPKLWELTDKLNSVEKVPSAVRENRRKRLLGLDVGNITAYSRANGTKTAFVAAGRRGRFRFWHRLSLAVSAQAVGITEFLNGAAVLFWRPRQFC